jgi:hypothetical protein
LHSVDAYRPPQSSCAPLRTCALCTAASGNYAGCQLYSGVFNGAGLCDSLLYDVSIATPVCLDSSEPCLATSENASYSCLTSGCSECSSALLATTICAPAAPLCNKCTSSMQSLALCDSSSGRLNATGDGVCMGVNNDVFCLQSTNDCITSVLSNALLCSLTRCLVCIFKPTSTTTITTTTTTKQNEMLSAAPVSTTLFVTHTMALFSVETSDSVTPLQLTLPPDVNSSFTMQQSPTHAPAANATASLAVVPQPSSSSQAQSSTTIIIVGAVVGGCLIAVIIVVVISVVWRHRNHNHNNKTESRGNALLLWIVAVCRLPVALRSARGRRRAVRNSVRDW